MRQAGLGTSPAKCLLPLAGRLDGREKKQGVLHRATSAGVTVAFDEEVLGADFSQVKLFVLSF